MKYFSFLFCFVLGLALNSAVVWGAADDSALVDIDVAGDAPVLRLNGIPLTAAVDCYFADSTWRAKNNVQLGNTKKIHRDGHRGGLTVTGKVSGQPYEYAMSWDGRKAVLRFSYFLPPGGEYIHGTLDLFMDQKLFPIKPEYQIGKEELGRARKDFVLSNEFGNFVFTFKTNNSKDAPWSVRDTSPQTWRPKKFQTISLINCTPLAGIKTQVEITMEYRPTPDGLRKLRALTLNKMLDSYQLNAFTVSQRQWIDQCRVQLQQLLSASTPAEWERITAEIRAHAQEFSTTYGACARSGLIVPAPQQQQISHGVFRLTAPVIGTDGSPDAVHCAVWLTGELKNYYGLAAATRNDKNNLQLRIDPQAVPGKAEAYRLKITETGVNITGTDAPGLFYGMQSFLQLIVKNKEHRLEVPCQDIRDWPDLKFRGFMIELGSHIDGATKAYDLIRRMIPRILARYKFNAAVIGESGSGVIRWQSHPETAWPHAISTAQLRELVADSRNVYLEPVPVIESLGHVRSILNAHSDLAEYNGKERVDAFCMSNPKVQKILADIYDECIDIFHPKYFHIGMDEAVFMGTCPKCSARPLDEIFTEYVQWCYDYLKKRQVKNVIMWHDLLMDKKDFPNYPCNMNAKSVSAAMSKLPKDIIMDFWEYGGTDLKPGIQYFRKAGFRVLGSSWYDDKNCFAMGQALADCKSLGILETSWTYTWEFDQMSLAAIENAWSVGRPSLKGLPYSPLLVAQRAMLPPQPSDFNGTVAIPHPLAQYCNSSIATQAAAAGIVGKVLLPTGATTLGGVSFELSNQARNVIVLKGTKNRLTIPINRNAVGLAFLQSAMAVNVFATYPMARYTVVYADGGKVEIPLINYRNIGALNMGAISMDCTYRERGLGAVPDAQHVMVLSSLAEQLNLHCFEWVNPQPERKIAAVEIGMTTDQDTLLLLGLSLIGQP